MSHSEDAAVTSVARAAQVITGAITRRLGTPAARMAVISPSVDMRLRDISTPTSKPIGTANVRVKGMARTNRCTDGPGRGGSAHQDFEKAADSLQEQNEGEQNRAQERAERDFAEDRSAEQTHASNRLVRRGRSRARWCWMLR